MAAATATVRKEAERAAPDEREFLIQKTKARPKSAEARARCTGDVISNDGNSWLAL